jgi:hypothetical protein
MHNSKIIDKKKLSDGEIAVLIQCCGDAIPSVVAHHRSHQRYNHCRRKCVDCRPSPARTGFPRGDADGRDTPSGSVMEPLVSCVCPTGNRSSLITMAVDCFLNQTYPNRELVILDDGETPTSVPEHPCIRYTRHVGSKLMTGAKRNRCNELASGEIICCWDDDDWSHPDRIAVQVERLKTGKEFTGFSRMYFYNRNGTAFQMHGGAFGTSRCYLKSFWSSHPYKNIQATEDVLFAQSAEAAGVADLISGEGLMVARRHGANTWDKINEIDLHRCTPCTTLPRGFMLAQGIEDVYPAQIVHNSYGRRPTP